MIYKEEIFEYLFFFVMIILHYRRNDVENDGFLYLDKQIVKWKKYR